MRQKIELLRQQNRIVPVFCEIGVIRFILDNVYFDEIVPKPMNTITVICKRNYLSSNPNSMINMAKLTDGLVLKVCGGKSVHIMDFFVHLLKMQKTDDKSECRL